MAVIALLTDFGHADAYAGIMKGVIAGIDREATLIDLAHGIPPQDVRAGAFALLNAWRYFPLGTIFLAVVDPGVGTERRPLAARRGATFFVGPDNGILSWALADRLPGEPEPEPFDVRVLDHPKYWLPEVSATFHGRDVFAPVAAHLSRGVPLRSLGTPADDYARLPFPRPTRLADGSLRGDVLVVDGFGNLVTNLRPDNLAPLGATPRFEIAGTTIVGLSRTYAETLAPGHATGPAGASVGLVAVVGSAGFLEIARPLGSAAETLGVGAGETVIVSKGAAGGP